jgi:hypothetical protein
VSFRLPKYFLLAFLAALSLSCREHIADTPVGHQPPSTYLWLVPDSGIRTGVSKQQLHWWGEAPGGVVRGFLFGFRTVSGPVSSVVPPDTQRYVWTTANDTTILFPLDTLFRYFAVTVRSVDNSFPGLGEKSAVRLFPFAYWDKNDNGFFDAGDVQLPGLVAATDPGGSVLTFPIRNSPPVVTFGPNPIDPTIAFKQPDTTYTAATFAFSGTDPDGNNTLSSFRIALNDTADPSNWLTISLRDTVVTLVVPRLRSDVAGPTVTADVYSGAFLGRRLIGQLKGLRLDALNAFYVEARDVAGEFSPPAFMPSGTNTWFVRRPRGRMLLVGDYINTDAQVAAGTYLSALAAVPGGQFASVDQLNIGYGLTVADKLNGKPGLLVPPYVDPALVFTFLLYDYIFWYTDQFPSLGPAQQSLFLYNQNGGKVIFSTSFLNTIDPRGALKDFAPIDSVSGVDLSPSRPIPPAYAGDTRIPGNFIVYADSSTPSRIYPQLAFNGNLLFHSVFMRPIYKRSDARYLYHLQTDTRVPQRYFGTPNLGVVDGQGTIIFIGLPLHLLDNRTFGNPDGLTAFFAKVVTQEFNPAQIVNRARF